MKRKLAVLLVAVMAMVCLAGCSGEGKLTEDDLKFYDAEGNVLRDLLETTDKIMMSYEYPREPEYTARGITIGNTEEEVKEAYKDLSALMEVEEKENGLKHIIYEDEKGKITFVIDANEEVMAFLVMRNDR